MPRTDDATRSAGLRLERVRASPQWRDGAFRNPTGITPGLQGNPLPLLGEYFFGGDQRTPPGPLPLVRPHDAWRRPVESGLRVTWLGHSTVLLELDGARLLTDPVFGARASPLSFAGPLRFHPVPAELAELPPLDAVLLSHDHFDHLCEPTARALAKLEVPIVTSLGVGKHLAAFGVLPGRVTELDWGESTEVAGVRFTATPCQHFSGRGLADRNSTLWSSWVLETARRKVFFSGDTGLSPQFEEIGRQHGPFELVMLEVGAYHPAWGGIHLGPHNALEVHRMLGGGALLPVHWGTFNLALHAWDEPAETLYTAAQAQSARLLTPMLGQPFEPAQVDEPRPWWRDVKG